MRKFKEVELDVIYDKVMDLVFTASFFPTGFYLIRLNERRICWMDPGMMKELIKEERFVRMGVL